MACFLVRCESLIKQHVFSRPKRKRERKETRDRKQYCFSSWSLPTNGQFAQLLGLDDEVPNTLQEAAVPVPTNLECKQSNPAYWLVVKDFHICVGDGDPSACRVSNLLFFFATFFAKNKSGIQIVFRILLWLCHVWVLCCCSSSFETSQKLSWATSFRKSSKRGWQRSKHLLRQQTISSECRKSFWGNSCVCWTKELLSLLCVLSTHATGKTKSMEMARNSRKGFLLKFWGKGYPSVTHFF